MKVLLFLREDDDAGFPRTYGCVDSVVAVSGRLAVSDEQRDVRGVRSVAARSLELLSSQQRQRLLRVSQPCETNKTLNKLKLTFVVISAHHQL